MKRMFKFKLTYFKPSGKYYIDEEVIWAIEDCGSRPGDAPDVLTPPSAYMPDAAAKVRGLRDSGDPGALPGLSGTGWDGPILLTCEDGFPVLILPKASRPAADVELLERLNGPSHLCVDETESNEPSWWIKDAQSIDLCRVCADCEDEKRARYRPEILTGYDEGDVDELIEEDGWS